MSAPTLAYLSASNQALGDIREARKLAEELATNWPDFDARVVLGRLYADPAQAAAVQKRIEKAGLREADGSN